MMSGEQSDVFGKDEVASIRNIIEETITAALPTALQQSNIFGEVQSLRTIIEETMTATLPAVLREIVPGIMLSELPKVLIDVKDEMKRIEKAKQDAMDFMNANPDKFNIGYKKRRKLFEGYARCDHLTKLYDECKRVEPVYIPKKFRDDKFFVRDAEELEIINVRFMGKFDSEYNLLKKRQRDFAKEINAEDDIIYDLIGQCNTSDIVKTEIAAIWEKDVKGDEEKIIQQWKSKITGMKTAYEKDKKKLAENNQKRMLKFEQLRQATRTVDIDENVNRFTISVGSFSMNSEEVGEERTSILARTDDSIVTVIEALNEPMING